MNNITKVDLILKEKLKKKKNKLYLKKCVKIHKNSTDIDGIDPIVQVANDSPKTLHYKFHIFPIRIVTSNGIMQQS